MSPRIIVLAVAAVLLCGCATPEDKLVGTWSGSVEIKRPPTGNASLDAQLAKVKTKADYTIEFLNNKSYTEKVARDVIVGNWSLNEKTITLTPKTVNGKDPSVRREDSLRMMRSLQISMPLPEGTNGPTSATISEDFKTITMPSIGTSVDLKKLEK